MSLRFISLRNSFHNWQQHKYDAQKMRKIQLADRLTLNDLAKE